MLVTLIIIALNTQTLYAYNGETLLFETQVSTGMRGHPTPPGWYKVLGKDPDHVSNLYPEADASHPVAGGAPMRYALLLERGLAIHEGVVTNPYASHGCCRVGKQIAKFLYQHTLIGVYVIVVESTQ